MSGKIFPMIALLALAACDPGAEPEASEPEASEPVAAATPSQAPPALSPTQGGDGTLTPERLAGEYRVPGVDGQDIDLPYGITASITPNTIHLTADCVNVEWGYLMHPDGTLSTVRVPAEGCARGLHPLEEALVAAFDGAERVTRAASNGYEFSGRGPTATLFSQ